MVRKKKVLLLWIFLMLALKATLGADITANSEFGCRWSGGSLDSGVICTCEPFAQEFFIQKDSVPSFNTVYIKIDGCYTVRFGSESISNMRNLRRIELMNIKNLYFDDSSISWNAYKVDDFYTSWDGAPTLEVKVEASTVKKISSYTFQGRISAITFKDSLIENIAPFAFSSLTQTQGIVFSNVSVVYMQAQAFKKFPMKFLNIINSSFDVLPSRTFSDVTVLDSLQIKNSIFRTIRSGAFLIYNPRQFEVTNCEIGVLEGEAFKVTARGSVKIKNNLFNVTEYRAFYGICLNKEEVFTEEQILFDSNTFNNLTKQSLLVNTANFTVKFNNISINQQCNCHYVNDELENSSDQQQFLCYLENSKEQITLKEFKDNNCSALAGYSTVLIVLGTMLIVFIIIFSGLVFYFKKNYRKQKEYITDKNGKPISLIMPDGRTYRETELHVVVERADLLTTDL